MYKIGFDVKIKLPWMMPSKRGQWESPFIRLQHGKMGFYIIWGPEYRGIC